MCGKDFPRKVNFCPFCGTRQGGSADGAQARLDERIQADERSRAAERAKADAQAKLDEQARVAAKRQADEQARADAARAEALAQVRDGAAAGSAAQPPSDALTSDQQAALERLNQLRGNSKPAGAGATKSTASASSKHPINHQGNGAPSSPPPLRKPISKSTWVLVAILLGLIWFLARPSDPAKKLQARVDQAVAQAQDCKIDLARNEYTSLKADKASAAQLKQVQDTISANAKKCDAKRNRAKAWTDLRPQLESALQSGSIDQADRRLAAFTKTWGADDETRELDGRIDVRKGERLLNDVDACIKRADRACAENKLQAAEKLQRNELKPRIEVLREALSQLLLRTVLDQSAASQAVSAPPVTPPARVTPSQPAKPVPSTQPGQQAQPAPQGQPSQQAQQARKLLSEAERELRQGNYKAAMDKANICATMIDEGNRECTALKNRAERLNRELMNCVASGREWIDDRCQ